MILSTVKAINGYTKSKKNVILLVILNFLVSLILIFYLNSIKELVNSVIEKEYGQLFIKCVITALAVAMNIIINCIISWINCKAKLTAEIHMKRRYFIELLNTYLFDVEKYKRGDIIARFNNDTDSIINYQINELVNFITMSLRLLLILIYIGLNNPYLLLFLAIVPIVIALPIIYGKKNGEEYKRIQRIRSDLNIKCKDMIDNRVDIGLNSGQAFFYNRFVKSDEDFICHDRKRAYYTKNMWISCIIGYQAIYVLLYVIGGILAFQGKIEFGIIVSTFTIIDPMVDMLTGLPEFIPKVYQVKENLLRYEEITSLKKIPLSNNISIQEPIKYSLNNVSFAYNEGHKKNIKNISYEFTSNEKILVIGKSGSGKSTFCKLLVSYTDQYDGKITINGYDLKDISSETIKENITYLAQDGYLRPLSLEENFKFVAPDIKVSEYDDYAKKACILNELKDMSDGYQTIVKDEGSNLSGGQKQRLNLMMALMRKKNFYVLDESFSAIDTETEKKILNYMLDNINGFILVTHRIHEELLNKFDRIIIMNEGEIVNSGDFNTIRLSSFYQDIVKTCLNSEVI